MGMFIVIFACTVGPAALSVLIHNWANAKKTDVRESILAFFVYVFVILLLSCTVVFLRGHIVASFTELFGTINNIVKYGATSLAFAVAVPNVLLLGKVVLKAVWGKKEKADE